MATITSVGFFTVIVISLTLPAEAVWPPFPRYRDARINNDNENSSYVSYFKRLQTVRESGSDARTGCECVIDLHTIETRLNGNEDLFDDVRKRLSDLESVVSNLQNALSALQMQPAVRSATQQGMTVAFSARVGLNRPFLGETAVIVFDEILINNGDLYDPYTGKFTSPLAGVYNFQATILSGFNSTIETMIVMNGDEVARLYSGAFNNRGSGSNSVNLNLKQGDEVWVAVFFGHGDYVHGQWSTFSGHLVYPFA